MELIEMIFNYKNVLIEAQIYPEEADKGIFYPVIMNGCYSFTLHFEDEKGWSIMKEKDGSVPKVEDELYGLIISQLKWELAHVSQ